MHTVDARGLTSTLQLVYAIAAALRLPGITTEEHAREELLGDLTLTPTPTPTLNPNPNPIPNPDPSPYP